MFEVLDYNQKKRLLMDFLEKHSKLTAKEIENLLDNFPFQYQELNFLSLQVLRQRKDIVSITKLAQRLGTDEDVAREILTSEERVALFPVASEVGAKLVKALLIPLNRPDVILIGNEPPKSFELIRDILNQGFLVVFDSDFDWNNSSSYMLSLYATLALWNHFRNMAFTGTIAPGGKLEQIQFLEKKKEVCRRKGIPLIYPSDCMKNIKDLERFITSLSVPLAPLPGADPNPFLKVFPFSEEYIRDVFHINSPLIYTTFEETVESFEKFAEWLRNTVNQLRYINENHVSISVGATSKPLPMAFYMGVLLSKARIPVDFYQYQEGSYKKSFTLTSDRDVPDTTKVERLIEVREPLNYKNIYIRMKTDIENQEGTLEIKIPKGEDLDSNILEIAFLVSKKLKTIKDCKRLFMETSVPFSFALGYFIEDYVCLEITHKGKVIYTLKRPQKGKLYLLNAFSLNMLEGKKAIVSVEEISREEALELLEEDFESYISHASTAQVLSSMLGKKVEMKRVPVKLRDGDRALVFQIKVRPAEGQIFTEEEVKSIVEEGMFSFYLVEVFY